MRKGHGGTSETIRREGLPLETRDQLPQAVLAAADQKAKGTLRPLGQCEEENQAGSQCSLAVRNTSDGNSTCGSPQVVMVVVPVGGISLDVKEVRAAVTAGNNGVAGGGP